MGLTVVTPPTVQPATLAETKAHLRVTHTDEDDYISSLIVAATQHIERIVGISLMERTYRLTLDAFSDYIELPRGPVQSVTSVQYTDEDGITQTVATADYTVDLTSNRQWIVRNSDATWPTPLDAVNVVTVEYVAGYDTLPPDLTDLRHAILLLVGHFYVNREAVNVGNIVNEMPLAVDALIQPHRSIYV